MKKTFLTVGIFLALAILLLFLNAQMRRAASAELALSESTLAAVADAASESSSLVLTVEKLLVSASTEQSAALLTQIALSADRVQRSVGELPDAQGERASIQAFLTSLSDQATALLTNLAMGMPITAEIRADLANDLDGLRLLSTELSLAQNTLLTGAPLREAMAASEVTAKPTAQELAHYRALPSTEVNSGTALQIAKEFVGVEKVTSVAHAPDTNGALPAFGVTVQTEDLQLNLEVTRRGGKILLMMPETADFPIRKTVEECTASALQFLSDKGFPRMEAPYYQLYDGLCVLTCVYSEQNVLIWPDRVLVQVRMDTGEVVGLEARSFWQNHYPRRLADPVLSEQEARALLSDEAQVTSARLCLLPQNKQERLCWQFTVQHGDGTFLVYIDSLTGQELRLEKLMHLESGVAPA